MELPPLFASKLILPIFTGITVFASQMTHHNDGDRNMTGLQLFGYGAGAVLSFMTLIWLGSLIRKDASIVDIFWGLGFVMLAAVYFAFGDGYPARKLLLLSLVAIWGLRLAIHIFIRNAGKGEDKRYRAWRMENPQNFWWISYFRVFLLQGILMLIISTPLMAAQIGPQPQSLAALDWIGVGLWLVGFFFEAVGDWQLVRFKADPSNAGKVLNTGLWYYTRHPNYFGEAVLWWGYFMIAAGAGGLWTIYSPVLMTFLLVRVSGVALLERTLTKERKGYHEYITSTSAFVPWFPKKSDSA